jgi:hypothetical protein
MEVGKSDGLVCAPSRGRSSACAPPPARTSDRVGVGGRSGAGFGGWGASTLSGLGKFGGLV